MDDHDPIETLVMVFTRGCMLVAVIGAACVGSAVVTFLLMALSRGQ